MDAVQDLIRQPAFAFKLANIFVGGVLIADAVGHFIIHSFSDIIIGIYAVLIGAALIGLELYTPPQHYVSMIYRYASFLFSFIGRGVFYVLAGVLMLNHTTWVWVLGTFVAVLGLVFSGLEFVKVVELPPSMMSPENDEESRPVWTAEQEG